jgi:hypothetical protein
VCDLIILREVFLLLVSLCENPEKTGAPEIYGWPTLGGNWAASGKECVLSFPIFVISGIGPKINLSHAALQIAEKPEAVLNLPPYSYARVDGVAHLYPPARLPGFRHQRGQAVKEYGVLGKLRECQNVADRPKNSQNKATQIITEIQGMRKMDGRGSFCCYLLVYITGSIYSSESCFPACHMCICKHQFPKKVK